MSPLSGKPVLVTGAGGFIGSALVEGLVAEGAEVRAFVRYNSRNDPGLLVDLDPDVLSEVEVVAGDIRDSESLGGAVRGRELVFHLGAQIAIPYSYVNPRDFFETNVLGTLNAAQGCLDAGATLIATSTSETYGSAQQVPITEDHPVSAQSPYAASKVGADQLALSYHRSYELPVTVLRPFNTYGPRQSARAVVPTIIAQALAGDVVRLGSLDPRRDMTFVGDTVSGFIAVSQAEGAIGQALQLGTGEDHSIGELVEAVGAVLGRELKVEEDPARVRPQDSEVMRLISDPAKINELTGWQAETDLPTGLAKTAAWIEAHPEAYTPDQYVI